MAVVPDRERCWRGLCVVAGALVGRLRVLFPEDGLEP